ncbi:hypothetical protein B0T09DRAFT_339549 [Sordaria sp. MPI-SDFR-AT-0083]|nr:hypothetical protein B0T09DRAFT_339549 [Sordaria sp. MPI-SDFR-AT-0083]
MLPLVMVAGSLLARHSSGWRNLRALTGRQPKHDTPNSLQLECSWNPPSAIPNWTKLCGCKQYHKQAARAYT